MIGQRVRQCIPTYFRLVGLNTVIVSRAAHVPERINLRGVPRTAIRQERRYKEAPPLFMAARHR